jgi:uncharacterized protein (TIGR02996 family)
MPSVMAIVSKGVFERDARTSNNKLVAEGDTWQVDRYLSKHKRLEPLSEGGSLYLVTVRPPDERLWLVAILESPSFAGDHWQAATNQQPVTDISGLRDSLKFDTGKGITAKPGALGMSLQTPRILTGGDEALLLGGRKATKKKATNQATKKAKATKEKREKTKATPATEETVEKTPRRPPPEPRPVLDGAARELSDALELLREGRTVDALDRLLDCWNRRRTAEVAGLVEQLGRQIDRSLEPVPGKPRTKPLEQAWLDRAAARRSADVGRLLAKLDEASARMLRSWFEQLDGFKADPRMMLPLLRVAAKYSSTEAGSMRTAAFKLATRVADGRALEHLPELMSRAGWIEDKAARLSRKLDPPPALPAEDSPAVEALGAAIDALMREQAPTEEELFAAAAGSSADAAGFMTEILADPLADPPRLVYGDWLDERGDPRGEFIALQYKRLEHGLTGKEARRERELIKDNASSWIHPLDAVVKKPRFERGFLSGCGEVLFETARQREALLEHPQWATVEQIDACNEPALILSPALRSLKVVRCQADTLAELGRRPEPLCLEEVSSSFADMPLLEEILSREGPYNEEEILAEARRHSLEHWGHVVEVGALRSLRRLRLSPDNGWLTPHCRQAFRLTWLTRSRLARQLELLSLDNYDTAIDVASWLETLPEMPNLATLELSSAPDDYYNSPNYGGPKFPCNVVWSLRRSEEKELSLECRMDWPYDGDRLRPVGETLTGALEGFPRPELPRLTLCYSGNKRAVDVGRFAEVAALIEDRFEQIELPDESSRSGSAAFVHSPSSPAGGNAVRVDADGERLARMISEQIDRLSAPEDLTVEAAGMVRRFGPLCKALATSVPTSVRVLRLLDADYHADLRRMEQETLGASPAVGAAMAGLLAALPSLQGLSIRAHLPLGELRHPGLASLELEGLVCDARLDLPRLRHLTLAMGEDSAEVSWDGLPRLLGGEGLDELRTLDLRRLNHLRAPRRESDAEEAAEVVARWSASPLLSRLERLALHLDTTSRTDPRILALVSDVDRFTHLERLVLVNTAPFVALQRALGDRVLFLEGQEMAQAPLQELPPIHAHDRVLAGLVMELPAGGRWASRLEAVGAALEGKSPSRRYGPLFASLTEELDARQRTPDILDAAEVMGPLLHDDDVVAALKWATNQLLLREEHDAARRIALWLVKRVPKDAGARYNVGVTFSSAGRFEEALPHYRQAVELDRWFGWGHNNLAWTLFRLGQLEEAEKVSARAVEWKDNGNAFWTRASILGAMGDDAGFYENIEQALKLGCKVWEDLQEIPERLRGAGRFEKLLARHRDG